MQLGAVRFNRAAAERTFRPALARVADEPPRPEVERGSPRMNDDQLRVVRRSLGSDTTFVWGPPGTGKTWTLARVVEAHFRAGRSVLLVSNTNVAVDVALEAVAERLCDEPAFDRGLVLRHGPIVGERLRRRFGAQVSPENVAKRLREARRNGTRQEALRHRREAEKARAALRRFDEADWVTWVISTADRWRLNATIARAERSAEEADAAAHAAAGNTLASQPEVPELLARCRILATTVHRTYGLRGGPPRHFDTVVVDEASTLMPPLVYWAAGLATRSVTVAGDFRQLPPVVAAPAAPNALKRDVFEVAGIPHRLKHPPAYLVSLGTQYRMREPICEAVNRLFYPERPLRSHPSVRHADTALPFSNAALLYLDTAPLRPWASWTKRKSHYHLCHALLVRNAVRRLAETGYLLRDEDVPDEETRDAVGVISPYRAQVRLIQKLLGAELGPCGKDMAFSIHRSQGKEWKTTIIDLTDSVGVWLGGFLKATDIEEVGARLLNVALSRAKHHSMLVGDFAYLRQTAPAGGFVSRLLDHFEQHGTRLIIHGSQAANAPNSDQRGVRVERLDPSEGDWPKRVCPMPSCGGRLVVRVGPKGLFLACTEFLEAPKCPYTDDLDEHTAGLLRPIANM